MASQPALAATATVTAVPATSAQNFTVAAAHGSRVGLIVWNAASVILYLSYDADASTTHYTTQVAAGASWTAPTPVYAGSVTGILASGTGTVMVTELT